MRRVMGLVTRVAVIIIDGFQAASGHGGDLSHQDLSESPTIRPEHFNGYGVIWPSLVERTSPDPWLCCAAPPYAGLGTLLLCAFTDWR
jgi:hypothetical protein